MYVEREREGEGKKYIYKFRLIKITGYKVLLHVYVY